MTDYFVLGSIVGLHGLNGYVKIKTNSLVDDYLQSFRFLYIDIFGDKRKFVVEDYLIDEKVYAYKFKNFGSYDDATYLLGKEIFLTAAQVNRIKELKIYFQAKNCKVVFKNEIVGVLVDILLLKNNNQLIVKISDKKEILIPFNDYFVEDFDPKNKILFIKNYDVLKT
ncbi:MAG TPA: hypothetical protein PLP99_07965 [Ignavibacteriales bacterium]|nr:hypothetical protein [Ignavibacteriales bacterium]